MNFDIQEGQCDLCGQKSAYCAVLPGPLMRLEACAGCLEDAREAIRRHAEENWQTGGPPIPLEGTAAAPTREPGTGT